MIRMDYYYGLLYTQIHIPILNNTMLMPSAQAGRETQALSSRIMPSFTRVLQYRKSSQSRYLILAIIALVAVFPFFFTSTTSTVARIEQPPPIPFPLTSQPLQPLQPPPNLPSTTFDYDLATLLNIPAFTSLRDRPPPLNQALIRKEATRREHSILDYYAQHSTKCAITPSIPRLRQAAQSYFHRNLKMDTFQSKGATLVIHHHPPSLDLAFVEAAANLAKRFRRVRLLIPDPRLHARLKHPRIINHHNHTTDDTLAFMFDALHLLVHTGPTSALGALLTSGTVYHTHALEEYTSQNAFKWLLHYRVSLSPEKLSPFVPSLSYMGRVRPSCCDLRPFGEGDEEKVACANTVDFTAPCWILSVGSRGIFGFERDVLKKTECHVHTFDCTGSWQVPKDIADRVTLHKLCLGDKSEGLFRTWGELIQIGSLAVTGVNDTMPSFAKMDIEGYEFPVIRSLTSRENIALPQQIAMELHQRTGHQVGDPYVLRQENSKKNISYVSDATIGELFQNLSKRGYDLVYRNDNPFCPPCSEVTLVKRSALPAE